MKKRLKYLSVLIPMLALCFCMLQLTALAADSGEYGEEELSEEIPFEYQMEQGEDLFESEIGSADSESKVQTKSVQVSQVDLYAMSETYEEYLEIPSSYAQTYQIEESDDNAPVYSVYSGESVTVSKSGVIKPAKTTWYLVEGSGSISYWTTMYIEGAKTRVEVEFGTSVIQVKTNSATYYITVNVHDYAQEYAQKVMDDYAAEKITDEMSELEKLEVITAFPAQYNYSASYSGYVGMIVAGGGDCWASTSAILYLCDKVGLAAHIRYAANDSGAGSGHRNVAVSIGSFVYIADAGYSGTAPRYYSVQKENTGFMYRYSSSDGTAKIVQYDGFESDIVVPSTIDGHTITTIGEKAFYYGESYSNNPVNSLILPDTLTTLEDEAISRCKYLTSITIPASVKTIGSFAFTDCEKMEAIYVEDGNSNFSGMDGVLYDASGETLLFYPINGSDTYIVPEGVKTIAEYAFYLTKKPAYVFLPKSISSIGFGAFGDSRVSKIYFYGNRPEIGTYAFKNASLTAYYPIGDTTWGEIENESYDASSITWKTWNPEASNLSDCIVELSGYDYVYNGKDIEPEVIVKDNGKTLKQDVDYEISYSNNKNSGTAYVIISGVDNGNYVGVARIPFTIHKAEPTLSFKMSVVNCGLIEENVKNPLTYETDGTIQYSSSDPDIASVTSNGNVTLKKTGSCTITATARESKNYTEKSVSYTLNIMALEKQQITVADNLTKTYGDKSFNLQATALGNAALSYSSDDTDIVKVAADGTVTIVGIGTAKIKIEAAATSEYIADSASVTITVYPKSIKNCRMIFTKIGPLPFDDSEFEPYLAVVDGEKILTEDVDYWISSKTWYGGIGTLDEVTQTILGEGNYTDSLSSSISPISQVPTLISAATSDSGVNLKWKKESGALGYAIYRKMGDGDYSKIKTISTSNTTTWTDPDPDPDKGAISYCIKAYTTDGTKYIYTSKSNVKSISDLRVPVLTDVSNTAKGIKITWSKAKGTTKYEVLRKTSGGSWKKVKTITNGATVSYTDTAVKSKNGVTYYYKVKAYCDSSYSGSTSEKKIVRLKTPSITGLKNVTGKKMKIKWSKNSSATGYQVKYVAGSSGKTVTVKKASSVSKVISGVKKGKTYKVYVRSYKKVSGVNYYSSWSSPKSVKIKK
ncbi:MAG: leucine-rich repeat protein [Lachnospiraceae bacterium]